MKGSIALVVGISVTSRVPSVVTPRCQEESPSAIARMEQPKAVSHPAAATAVASFVDRYEQKSSLFSKKDRSETPPGIRVKISSPVSSLLTCTPMALYQSYLMPLGPAGCCMSAASDLERMDVMGSIIIDHEEPVNVGWRVTTPSQICVPSPVGESFWPYA